MARSRASRSRLVARENNIDPPVFAGFDFSRRALKVHGQAVGADFVITVFAAIGFQRGFKDFPVIGVALVAGVFRRWVDEVQSARPRLLPE